MACCGLSGKSMTSMMGLLAFLIFSVVFGSIGLAVLLVLAIFSERCRLWAKTLWTLLSVSVPRMFDELINSSYFLRPDLKCVVSGKFFRVSPAFSGFVFKYFNLLILGLMAGIVVVLVSAI